MEKPDANLPEGINSNVTIEFPHPLFAHIKNAISLERQKELLEGVKHIGTGSKRYRYGFTKLCAFIVGDEEKLEYKNWIDVPFQPAREAQILNTLVKQNTSHSMKCDDFYSVGMIECLGFEKGSTLNEHVDFVKGFAIIISLGATANFFFRVKDEEVTYTIKAKSGDAVMFPSHGAANILHGISSFDDDCPDWFHLQDYVRICVQYRQDFEHVYK